MNDVDTGALGASGRFARMEAALERIELKLDLKADLVRVTDLERRHHALEERLSGLVDGTIIPARSAELIARFQRMEQAVDRMERDDSNKQAVLDAAKNIADSRYTRLAWVVGLVTIVNLILNLAPFRVIGT